MRRLAAVNLQPELLHQNRHSVRRRSLTPAWRHLAQRDPRRLTTIRSWQGTAQNMRDAEAKRKTKARKAAVAKAKGAVAAMTPKRTA